MKIINKLNMFIKNLTSPNNKKEEFATSSLNICDMSVQQEEFSKIAENDKLITEPLLSEEQPNDCSTDDQTSLSEQESEEATAIEKPTSLLDNSEYMTLAQQCCDILSELDRMQNQITNKEILDFITHQKSRIREALLLSGATLIDEESEFNILRHQCINVGIVNNGMPIVETVDTGVEIDGRILVKAKIRI